MAKESAAFSFFDFFANAVEEEPLPAEHSVIELFNFQEQPLMAVACLCALAYVVILFSLLCYRMYIRNSRDTSKPWLGNFIDVCLEIPALLEIGPYSKENDIFDALESAMKETNLTDFGLKLRESASIDFDDEMGLSRLQVPTPRRSIFSSDGSAIINRKLRQSLFNDDDDVDGNKDGKDGSVDVYSSPVRKKNGSGKSSNQVTGSAIKMRELSLKLRREGEFGPLADALRKDPYGFVTRYRDSVRIGLEKSRARYSPLGQLVASQTIHRRMVMRLRHVEYMKSHPLVSKVPVKKPLFVIGFPRTGTTFLHEMLGLHPLLRMHYLWEQYEHVPTTSSEDCIELLKDRRERYNKNKAGFTRKLALVGDELTRQNIHRMGYDEPEECTTPCAFELPFALGSLPFYIFAHREVIPQGCGRAFEFYKEYLQMLSWQRAGTYRDYKDNNIASTANSSNFTGVSSNEALLVNDMMQKKTTGLDAEYTWMLKSPFHLPYLEELFATFPDATVIWTHRDPAECIASACSLYWHLMSMATESDSIDKHELGQAVLNYTKMALDKAEDSIRKIEMMHSVKYRHDPYKGAEPGVSGGRGGSGSKNRARSVSSNNDSDADPFLGVRSPYTATDPATTPMSTISTDSTTRSVPRKGRGKSSVKVIHIRYKDSITNSRDTAVDVLDRCGFAGDESINQVYEQKLDAYLAAGQKKRAAAAATKRRSQESKTSSRKESTEKKDGSGSGHSYSMEEFGLNRTEVDLLFKEYTDKYRLCTGSRLGWSAPTQSQYSWSDCSINLDMRPAPGSRR